MVVDALGEKSSALNPMLVTFKNSVRKLHTTNESLLERNDKLFCFATLNLCKCSKSSNEQGLILF
jgi:hypothetical protein